MPDNVKEKQTEPWYKNIDGSHPFSLEAVASVSSINEYLTSSEYYQISCSRPTQTAALLFMQWCLFHGHFLHLKVSRMANGTKLKMQNDGFQ